MSAGSPRRGRLSRSAEFERVYRQGRSVSNRHLVLYSFPADSGGPPRLGLSVSRKVGSAVDRNLVKRLLRESFQKVRGDVRDGHDLVVVARPAARELAERDGLQGISATLGELLERAGLTRIAQTGDGRRRAVEADAGTGAARPGGSGVPVRESP